MLNGPTRALLQRLIPPRGEELTDTLGGTSTGAYLDPYRHVILPLIGG